MPVKIENCGENISQGFPKEIECLVKEVRERLCLKSQDKLSKCYRSTPYSVTSPCRGVGNVPKGTCMQCGSNKKRSPFSRPDKHCGCQDKTQQQENPHKLLEQLLREQTLIQEAVRRLHSRTTTEASREKSQFCDSSSPSTKPSSSFNSSVCSYETGSPVLAL